jgi:hypothetical protein
MNKSELKNFAVSARRELLEKVALRAKIFGIDEKNGLRIEEKFGQIFVNGTGYPQQMKSAFHSLSAHLESKGYEQLLEEVAYTWFNRIIAIRYMEVNDYLPSRVNILSSKTGKAEPDILTLFETIDLDIDFPAIKDIIHQGKTEEAYRKLFIAQCNALNNILPFMFEKIYDYTELLLPDFLLDSESVINKLTKNEELTISFQEVEVIGWLYQYYNSEPKAKVLEGLKGNKKVTKDSLPAATQLFTPKWIVKYMVENSLGKLWVENNSDSKLIDSMEFFIKPKNMKAVNSTDQINIEELKIIDPCCGSGNILLYTFDLLFDMYEELGYPSREISYHILEKNLFGLDIDERAIQLAKFSLVMKARSKTTRLFKSPVVVNLFTIVETKYINKHDLINNLFDNNNEKNTFLEFMEEYDEAQTFGSLIKTKKYPTSDIKDIIKRFRENNSVDLFNFSLFESFNYVEKLINQHEILHDKYDLVITNPPYLGVKGMDPKLSGFVNKYYPDNKHDLYACFIERAFHFGKENSYIAMVTPFTWMFLKSYEQLRESIVNKKNISSLIQLEYNGFEVAMVPVCTFVLKNKLSNDFGEFINLSAFKGFDNQPKKTLEAIVNPEVDYRFSTQSITFSDIPSKAIAYWTTKKTREIFKEYPTLNTYADVKKGMFTGDNDRFLRKWFEVNNKNIGFNLSAESAKKSNYKWFPYNKGGSYKKWYGNQNFIINWHRDGEELKKFPKFGLRNPSYYFLEGITWSALSSSNFSARYTPKGFLFDSKGSSLFPLKYDELNIILGFLCSKVGSYFLSLTSATLDFSVGQISQLPFKPLENNSLVNNIVNDCVTITKDNWNSFEISWDFTKHPFLQYKNNSNLLSNVYNNWESKSVSEFERLKFLETELNNIYINHFGLTKELTPEIADQELTILVSDRNRDTKSFISYFIGCLVGRYSLDIDGLTFAGGYLDNSMYHSFKPNKYGIVNLTDEQYFEDDIIIRLRDFLSITFSQETVDENLQWLAESLDLKRNESAEDRLRRYFLDEFFKDHCQVYQKRPIYWLVDSGKQKGLRTLIYMHRYQPDTMATIRFEHLQEIQAKYLNEISALEARLVNPSLTATEKRELEKRKTDFQKRLDELLEFDKKLAEYANAQISIDLDDGVNVNYSKFEKVLAKIK